MPSTSDQPKKCSTYRHDYTRQANIGAQPLANPCGLPYRTDKVVLLVAIDDAGEDVVRVCCGADCKEDDEEQGLEVEERGLRSCQC